MEKQERERRRRLLETRQAELREWLVSRGVDPRLTGNEYGTRAEALPFIRAMVEFVERREPDVSGLLISLIGIHARKFRIRDVELARRLLVVMRRGHLGDHQWYVADAVASLASRENWPYYREAILRTELGKDRGPLLLNVRLMAKEDGIMDLLKACIHDESVGAQALWGLRKMGKRGIEIVGDVVEVAGRSPPLRAKNAQKLLRVWGLDEAQ